MFYLAPVSLILNIDTAVQTASVCLAKNGKAVAVKTNPSQKDHAAWLQPAIASILEESAFAIHDLDAVAVSAGPGSYTGLRVGMATAKGICYALQKPLLLVGTLKMMAAGAVSGANQLICPLIDARRMEVFAAVYNQNLDEHIAPHNCILTELSFKDLLDKGEVLFIGNGSQKLKGLVFHENAIFSDVESTAAQMAGLSYQQFLTNEHANLAYTEPFYGKEFYSPAFQKP